MENLILFRDLPEAEVLHRLPASVRDMAQRAVTEAATELGMALPLRIAWMEASEADTPACYYRDAEMFCEVRPDEPKVVRLRFTKAREEAVRAAANACKLLKCFQDGSISAVPKLRTLEEMTAADEAAYRFEIDFAARFLGAPLRLVRPSLSTGALVGA